jgi:hypothetical protein
VTIPPLANLVAVITWTGVIVALIYRSRQQLGAARNFNAGRLGEDRVVEALRTLLDQRWTIFRSLRLPDGRGDVDIVLVGPAGVWAIEVKAFRPTIRYADGQWEYQTKKGWKKLRTDPGAQVRRNAMRTRDYLQRKGINITFVEPVIALATEQPPANVESSPTPVWDPSNLGEKIAAIRARERLSEQETTQITALFKERVEQRSEHDRS